MLLQGKNSFLENAYADSTNPDGAKIVAAHCRIHRRGCSGAILLLRPLHLQNQ
jgi:hypothetical protein